MSTYAALLLLSVATAFLFISSQSTCINPIICSCGGNTPKSFQICAEEQNSTAADPCTQWLECCQDGSNPDGPSCSTATIRTPRSRRKRQYRTNRRPGRPSYPTGSVQSAPQGQYGDGSPRSFIPKYVKWRWDWEINRSFPKMQNSVRQRGDCSDDIDSPKLGSLRCTTGGGRKSCTGTCIPGYTFENRYEEVEMVLSCLDGRWTPARAFPPCVSGGHCDLVVEGTGRYNCTTGMQGTRCDVFCDTRYEGRFNCYPGRPWEPSLPHCVRPKGGESVSTEGRQPCRCEYGASCDRDGRCVCPVGRTGTLCESIVAEKQPCGDPGFVDNGYRRHLNGSDSRSRKTFENGESLVFGCRTNKYALQGSAFMTCRDGAWSESLPKCIEPNVPPETACPDPGQVDNADRLNTDGSISLGVQSYRPGQSVAYTCRRGYALQRRSLITCQTSGSWSNFLPYCTPILSPESVVQTTTASPDRGIVFCRDPGSVENGNRVPVAASNRRGFPQGSSLDYSCNQGYTLKGEGSLFCLVSRRWSSTVPKCEEQPGGDGEYCLNPGSIPNGKIIYYPNINSRRGSENSLDDPEYPPGVRLVYSCNEGYRLQGSSEMTCRGDSGLWSTYPPTCLPSVAGTGIAVYCGNPGPLANGQRMHFPSLNSRTGSSQGSTEDPEYPEGTRFEYSCNAGYTMEGRRSQTCEKGYWSAAKPSCKVFPQDRMYCDNPGIIINGKVRHFPPAMNPKSGTPILEDDLEYPEGTRLQYSCDDGFTLVGSSELTCLSTSHWSSPYLPICSAECGLPSSMSSIRIFNGTRTLEGEWPWVVSIRENNESQIICGGAVLNSRTVITAAHCLTDSDSYLLYFGKIHKLDKDDDDQVKKRRSTRIILHPDYSDTSMESDIGLVHFSERIQFTDRIQPICLPDTLSTVKNLRTGSRGFVTGFGENQFGLQPNELMQARIPVQDNNVCVEYYKRHGITLVMSQNMFCAGFAGGDQATCQGDSGSALVFFDGTFPRFTLEGIVSFATNGQCGVQGRYTVFTKVFPFVPWILENLA